MYKISIIVPCYNTKPWLDECLQSLVDQTLQEIEIICVNDGSTDGTGEKLDEWQAQYPNKIKVIHQKNGGSAKSRNTGMKIAQGECIGFVDSDDLVSICMYEKLYKVLADNNADVVKCDCLEFIEQENIIKKLYNNQINILTNITKIFNTSIACSTLYKNKYLQRHNIQFAENIRFAEDHAFAYEFAMHSPKLILLSDKLYYYRKQRKGQLTSYNGKNIYDIFKVFEYLQNKIADNELDNLVLIRKLIIKKQLSMFAIYAWKIKNKYKKDFLFKASNLIFNNNKALTIYKTMLFAKYRNIFSYFIAPIAVILFHSCYLWQKISFKNIKNYFATKFN